MSGCGGRSVASSEYQSVRVEPIDANPFAMDRPIIEREYPYRHSLVEVSLMFLATGILTCGCLWWIADHRDIIINGIIPLRGAAALIFRCAATAMMALLFLLSGKILCNRITSPNQRIAFTAKGIFLPRNKWTTMEEFV